MENREQYDGVWGKEQAPERKLISVIVPIYCVEAYLPRCLESICGQTWPQLEILLVDDGSPDLCGQICEAYAERDDRIFVIHKANGGLSEARNAGLARAHGDWVCFIDSDDFIAVDMLETLYRRCVQEGSDMAVCDLVYVDERGRALPEYNRDIVIADERLTVQQAWDKLCAYKHWYYVMVQNKLYRRTLFEEISFPKGKLHEDEFVMYRLIGKCRQISCVKGGRYYYTQRRDSIMGSPYSVRRLDGVEAYLEQADFFLEIGRLAHAAYAVGMIDYLLKEGREKLDMSAAENKRRYRELVRAFSAVLRRFRRRLPLPARTVYFFFRRHKRVIDALRILDPPAGTAAEKGRERKWSRISLFFLF